MTLHCVSCRWSWVACIYWAPASSYETLVYDSRKYLHKICIYDHINDSTSACIIHFIYTLVLEDAIGSDVGVAVFWPTYGAPLDVCVNLPRDAMHKRGLCRHAVSVRPSVRLSVCLSRSWIMSKRIKISPKFFYRRVATPF